MDSLASHNVPLPYLPLVTDMGTQAGYWRGRRRNGKSRTNVRSLVERDISIVVGWEGAVEWNGTYGTPLPTPRDGANPTDQHVCRPTSQDTQQRHIPSKRMTGP
jgi:hypothetical protein